MSYEGYEERLCKRGHRVVRDCYDSFSKSCSNCGGEWEYYHMVDQTNGIEEGNPQTYHAPIVLSEIVDIWQVDHYGNKYAAKEHRFKPAPNSEWRKFTEAMGIDDV